MIRQPAEMTMIDTFLPALSPTLSAIKDKR